MNSRKRVVTSTLFGSRTYVSIHLNTSAGFWTVSKLSITTKVGPAAPSARQVCRYVSARKSRADRSDGCKSSTAALAMSICVTTRGDTGLGPDSSKSISRALIHTITSYGGSSSVAILRRAARATVVFPMPPGPVREIIGCRSLFDNSSTKINSRSVRGIYPTLSCGRLEKVLPKGSSIDLPSVSLRGRRAGGSAHRELSSRAVVLEMYDSVSKVLFLWLPLGRNTSDIS